MNGAQYIVNALHQQGVTQVFGYPGGAIMPVYDALYDGGIPHLLCRHEQGAAMAAVLLPGPARLAVVADAWSGPASADCALAGQGIQPTLLLAAKV